MTSTSEADRRVSRQDWVDAAVEQLAEAGIGAVSVDRLAARIGVTRGSFYYHFANRADLLREMLDYWAQRWTYDVRNQIVWLDLDPSTTLLALMKAFRNNRAADYDAPFRAWALHDPIAHAVVRQIDQVRLDAVRAQFEALGFTGLDRENRARLLLYYEMAAPVMLAEQSSEQDEQLLVERHRFLTNACFD